eukprot:m.223765 g.223765  ORF g.223765 m.223765 type:complete len:294 (-) comp18758_c2_seq4:44-925(-)
MRQPRGSWNRCSEGDHSFTSATCLTSAPAWFYRNQTVCHGTAWQTGTKPHQCNQHQSLVNVAGGGGGGGDGDGRTDAEQGNASNDGGSHDGDDMDDGVEDRGIGGGDGDGGSHGFLWVPLGSGSKSGRAREDAPVRPRPVPARRHGGRLGPGRQGLTREEKQWHAQQQHSGQQSTWARSLRSNIRSTSTAGQDGTTRPAHHGPRVYRGNQQQARGSSTGPIVSVHWGPAPPPSRRTASKIPTSKSAARHASSSSSSRTNAGVRRKAAVASLSNTGDDSEHRSLATELFFRLLK